jgi:ferric iron reductase protein FhuF
VKLLEKISSKCEALGGVVLSLAWCNLYANLDKGCVALLWPLPFIYIQKYLKKAKEEEEEEIMKTQLYFTMQKYHLPKTKKNPTIRNQKSFKI